MSFTYECLFSALLMMVNVCVIDHCRPCLTMPSWTRSYGPPSGSTSLSSATTTTMNVSAPLNHKTKLLVCVYAHTAGNMERKYTGTSVQRQVSGPQHGTAM